MTCALQSYFGKLTRNGKHSTSLNQENIEAFLSEKQPALRVPLRDNPSASAKGILQLSPHAIDRVRAKHGETLRFNGLPFARVRTVMERENVWFGIDRSQRKRLRRTPNENGIRCMPISHLAGMRSSRTKEMLFIGRCPKRGWNQSCAVILQNSTRV